MLQLRPPDIITRTQQQIHALQTAESPSPNSIARIYTPLRLQEKATACTAVLAIHCNSFFFFALLPLQELRDVPVLFLIVPQNQQLCVIKPSDCNPDPEQHQCQLTGGFHFGFFRPAYLQAAHVLLNYQNKSIRTEAR